MSHSGPIMLHEWCVREEQPIEIVTGLNYLGVLSTPGGMARAAGKMQAPFAVAILL